MTFPKAGSRTSRRIDLLRQLGPLQRLLMVCAFLVSRVHGWLRGYLEFRDFHDLSRPRGWTMHREKQRNVAEIDGIEIAMRRFSSDPACVVQCFAERQYQPACDILASLGESHPVIIDAGANIGCASLYIASRFPNGLVIALEPDEANFSLLEENARRNPGLSIQPVRAGLWGQAGRLAPSKTAYRDGRAWARQFKIEADDVAGATPAKTVPSIMKDHGLPLVHLLKIDIEGAEYEVFADPEACLDWLPKVAVIAIELHYEPARQLTVIQLLERAGFDCSRMGEVVLAVNRMILPDSGQSPRV